MPETAETGKAKAALAKAPKVPAPKHAPKRFDPFEHGGVKKRGSLFLFFGVILPTLALLFETNFHFCARHFFDPFPSAGHVVLFALVPFSNYLVWLATRRDLSNHYAFMSLVSGMAMGVACLYTLMFLPLTPMACLFSLALGFGLLALEPLLSLPCNWMSGKTVCHLAAKKVTYFNAHQVEHLGHMIILVMVIAIELPSTLTRINLSHAADPNPSVSRDGIAWLRRFGSQEVLLRACYERSGRATDILGSLYESAHPLNIDQTRRVFYQVTGKPFNSVPIPRSARATIQHTGVVTDPSSPNSGVEDEFDLDTDIAGEAVSGVARGLSVSQSKFDGKIDPDGALASLTWSFAFTNDSKIDREARAKILLPPQAVVTKATLTVNNVERDATIMVRSAARARYRQAVAEHKDPLLVSTCGVDQILVQCFPVRPGETMKVKLQIAAPMSIDQNEKATLLLPAFLERNFQVELPNTVDIQSPKPLTAGGLTANTIIAKDAQGASASCHLLGNLDASHLAGFSSIIEAERDKSCRLVWCKTDKFPGGAEIEHNVAQPHYADVKNLIVVIDASAAMKQFMPQIVKGLKTLPPSISAQIKVVGDTTLDLCPAFRKGGDLEYNNAVDSIGKVQPEGGQDDYTALYSALTAASALSDTSVLWIHAAQPVTSGSSFGIKANLERASSRPLLFDMQLVAGPNEILIGINAHTSLVRVPRSGSPNDDLSALWIDCRGADGDTTTSRPATQPEVEYKLLQGASGNSAPAGHEVDGQLAQIWANRQICRAMQTPEATQGSEVNFLAGAFQIVSPVSSAVVTQPVAPAVPEEAETIAPKSAFSISSLNPELAFRHIRRSAMESGGKAVDQLSSLSSAISSGLSNKDVALSNDGVDDKMLAAPAPSIAGNAVQTAGTVRRDNNVGEMLKSGSGYFQRFAYQKQEAPVLQGATNGTICHSGRAVSGDAFGSLGGNAPASSNAPASLPAAPDLVKKGLINGAPGLVGAPVDPRYGQSNEVGDIEAAAPPAKIVPEADTWLLLMVIALLLAATWFARRRAEKNGLDKA